MWLWKTSGWWVIALDFFTVWDWLQIVVVTDFGHKAIMQVVHFYAGKEASYSIYGDQQILELQCQ